jgi:hypothetical protein
MRRPVFDAEGLDRKGRPRRTAVRNPDGSVLVRAFRGDDAALIAEAKIHCPHCLRALTLTLREHGFLVVNEDG